MHSVLLYGLEICPLNKAELHLRDFAVTRFLMKLFKTSSIAVIKDCCRYFGSKLPSELLEILFKKFYDTLCTYSIIVGFPLLGVCFSTYVFLQMHVLPMCWWIKIDIQETTVLLYCVAYDVTKMKKNIKILEFNWYDTIEIFVSRKMCCSALEQGTRQDIWFM